MAGFRTGVIDDREQYANRERFPEAVEVLADDYEKVFPKLEVNNSSYLIIVTRGHRDDMKVLGWAARSQARYVAMIGSKRKTIEVCKHLLADGVTLEQLSRVHAPMGFDIGAITPEEIAVAVVAEMIHHRRRPTAGWSPLSKSIFAEGAPRALEIHAGDETARQSEAKPAVETPSGS